MEAYLVPQPLAGDDGDFIAYPLVGLEIEGEFGVVALDDDFGGFLDRLRANATHFGGVVVFKVSVETICASRGRFRNWRAGRLCAKTLCLRPNFDLYNRVKHAVLLTYISSHS